MDSSELVYKCVGLMGTSVSAWWQRFFTGGFSFREFKIKSLSEMFSGCTRFALEEIKVCTRWLLLSGCGGFSLREFRIKSWSEIFSGEGFGFVCTRFVFEGFMVCTRLGLEEIKVCTGLLLG